MGASILSSKLSNDLKLAWALLATCGSKVWRIRTIDSVRFLGRVHIFSHHLSSNLVRHLAVMLLCQAWLRWSFLKLNDVVGSVCLIQHGSWQVQAWVKVAIAYWSILSQSFLPCQLVIYTFGQHRLFKRYVVKILEIALQISFYVSSCVMIWADWL